MTRALAEATRLLEQSRRELVALLAEARVAGRAERSVLVGTLLDIAEASARHETALEGIRSRLDAIERSRR